MKPTDAEVDPKFYRYIPEPVKVLVPNVRAIPIQQLNAERLERVRKRQINGIGDGEVNDSGVKRRRLRSKGPACRG